MKILNVRDAEFKAYGKVVEGLDVSSLLKALEETPKPDDVIYVASDEKLEACDCAEKIAYSLFGGMPIQIGYCNGSNYLLNAVEYHRDSEVNVALTDLILLLGKEHSRPYGIPQLSLPSLSSFHTSHIPGKVESYKTILLLI